MLGGSVLSGLDLGEDLRVWCRTARHPRRPRGSSCPAVTNPLSDLGRLRLARCVVERGWPVARTAERFQVSRTRPPVGGRYRDQGLAGWPTGPAHSGKGRGARWRPAGQRSGDAGAAELVLTAQPADLRLDAGRGSAWGGCGNGLTDRPGRWGLPGGSGPTSGRHRCGRCPSRQRHGRRGGQRRCAGTESAFLPGEPGVSVGYWDLRAGWVPSDSSTYTRRSFAFNNPRGQYT